MSDPIELTKLQASLKNIIDEKGFSQTDKRLNRTVQALPGHFVVITNQLLLEWLRTQKLLEKYKDDSKRMYSSFRRIMSEAKKDPNSRRLMVFNDSKYSETYECFTHFQFVYTQRNEFDMIVYQRSSDLEKLKDDLIFFSHQMRKFERGTDHYVTKLVIVYAHVHYQTEK